MCPDDLEIWLNHFEHHGRYARSVPQGMGDALSPEEGRLIARSIETFELGRKSDRLMLATRRFADADPALTRIVELLGKEQQRRAEILRAFVPERRMPPTDNRDRVLFAAGMELDLCRLLTAELIGTVYYRALGSVTRNPHLKLTCRTLVADALAHIGFESELVLALRARHPSTARGLARLCHRTFLASSAALVWLTHRSLLRLAGFGPRSFLRACQDQYDFYLEPTKPAVADGAKHEFDSHTA
jgi:hypothetical protein